MALYSSQEFHSFQLNEEIKAVNKIANNLSATTEYDWQMISMNLLKSLQVLGKFLFLLQQLESSYRNCCQEIQKHLFQNDLNSSFPNDLESIYLKQQQQQQHPQNVSYGQLYGNYLLLTENVQVNGGNPAGGLAELKSFLSTNAGFTSMYTQSSIFSIVYPTIKKLKNRIGNSLISLSNTLPVKLLTAYGQEESLTQEVTEDELEQARINLLPQSSVTQVRHKTHQHSPVFLFISHLFCSLSDRLVSIFSLGSKIWNPSLPVKLFKT